MTERKSNWLLTLGLLFTYFPLLTLLVTWSAVHIPNWPVLLAGGAVYFAGWFLIVYAHEHAKSLKPCGKVYLNKIGR